MLAIEIKVWNPATRWHDLILGAVRDMLCPPKEDCPLDGEILLGHMMIDMLERYWSFYFKVVQF